MPKNKKKRTDRETKFITSWGIHRSPQIIGLPRHRSRKLSGSGRQPETTVYFCNTTMLN